MLYEIFHENWTKKFRLLSSFLTFMNRVGKKIDNNKNKKKKTNKETNKTQYNSL